MEMQAADRLAAFQTFCPECSDEELVDRALAGQWVAFEQLVKRYQDAFFRLGACSA